MASSKSVAEDSSRPTTTGLDAEPSQAEVCDVLVQCHLANRDWDCSRGPARPAAKVSAVRMTREWTGQTAGDEIDAQTKASALSQLSRYDDGHSDMIMADFMQRLGAQRPHEAVSAAMGRILPDQLLSADHLARADIRSSRNRASSSSGTFWGGQATFVSQTARATSRGRSSGQPWSHNRAVVTSELRPVLDGQEAVKVKHADVLPMATYHMRRAYNPTLQARLTKPVLQPRTPEAAAQRSATLYEGGGLKQ